MRFCRGLRAGGNSLRPNTDTQYRARSPDAGFMFNAPVHVVAVLTIAAAVFGLAYVVFDAMAYKIILQKVRSPDGRLVQAAGSPRHPFREEVDTHVRNAACCPWAHRS